MKTGVIDSIQSGVIRILFEDENKELFIKEEDVNIKISEGDWVDVEITEDYREILKVNKEKTQKQKDEIESLISLLKSKRNSKYLK